MFAKITELQELLASYQLDGWLLYDFRRSNDLACHFLGISQETLLTRRFFYWIPKKGEPVKIVHRIETHCLEHLPGRELSYVSWQELEGHLASVLKSQHQIAMEYSPRNAVPYVSKVDAGTMELVRGFGVDVVSSADLLQKYTCVWDAHKLQSHLKAAEVLDVTAERTWKWIANQLNEGLSVNEYQVQQFMIEQMALQGCLSEAPPICAVNEHSANPHFSPKKEGSTVIKKGDFILIDLWCKQKTANAVYADITRVGVAATQPTARQKEIFAIVRAAQLAGTELVKSRFQANEPLMGWEVDARCRQVITDAGYGEYFIHRTGHNIDIHDHGDGAHLDNLETQDRRLLLRGTCFSIEPGIYLPGEFGVRLEYDIYVHPNGQVQVTGGVQDSIRMILDE